MESVPIGFQRMLQHGFECGFKLSSIDAPHPQGHLKTAYCGLPREPTTYIVVLFIASGYSSMLTI